MAQAQLDYVQKVKIEENQSMKVEKDQQNLINSLEIPQPINGNMNQLDQNIFQDNNDSLKKRLIRKYNLQTNLSYTRFSADEFKKTSFTIDIIAYFVQYLNLTGLDRKLETKEIN